jgi:hypothetical protein
MHELACHVNKNTLTLIDRFVNFFKPALRHVLRSKHVELSISSVLRTG